MAGWSDYQYGLKSSEHLIKVTFLSDASNYFACDDKQVKKLPDGY